MTQQQDKYNHPLHQFNPGNSVKVGMVSGEELKGIYLGTVIKEPNTDVEMKRGVYIVVMIGGQKPVVVDVLNYCETYQTRVEKVTPTRLSSVESSVLRAFFKEFEKSQRTDTRDKRTLSVEEIGQIIRNNKEGLRIHTTEGGRAFVLTESFNVVAGIDELGLREVSNDEDELTTELRGIENYLTKRYPNATVANYKKLVHKYQQKIEFNEDVFMYYVIQEESGDTEYDSYDEMFEVELNVWFKFKSASATKDELESYLKDLASFKNYVSQTK